MSVVQKLFVKILPKRWAEDMEAHSRSWMIRCRTCGSERSVWDIGGIRWRAVGSSATLMRCQNCGQVRLHTIYRKSSADGPR